MSRRTGKPYKPTTQGDRTLYQTLFRFFDKQPLAETLEQRQEQIHRFDEIHNTERPHQGLPGRIAPAQSWGQRRKVNHRAQPRGLLRSYPTVFE